MKKSLKITLVCALALFLLAGCAAAPASSAENLSTAYSSTGTVLTAALSASDPDTTVSKRDASGEYDASEAVALAPDGDLTITEWLTGFSPVKDVTYVRGFLGRMLFAGEDGVKHVNILSGGEKVRCQLSKMMISGANCLIFDEPTNHLDMESISALNEGMMRFPGVELFACRDHQVVQTTANRIIEILPDGSIIDKVSTYDDYLENNADARKRTVYVASREEDSN